MASTSFRPRLLPAVVVCVAATVLTVARPQAAQRASGAPLPTAAAIEARIQAAMAGTRANGLAVGVIERGQVRLTRAFGIRNARRDPLTPDTIMYGASITKAVFARAVMQLVDAGRVDLDRPFADMLAQPLPSYPDYASLASDPRWQALTPRMALTHSTGFANFAAVEPDHTLHIHFTPGTRYAYSGEGLLLLQFALEHQSGGRSVNVGELTRGMFARLGMSRTSLQWRDDFAANLADGWNDRGEPQPHDQRSRVRVAGSMDTTIQDISTFAAALVRGDGLTPASRAEMVRPQVHITTAHQFPTLLPDLPPWAQRPDLFAGLGVVVFTGPQGRGFYKGGHDEQTANTLVCLERGQRCVVLLSNDVRAEAAYADLVRFVLGDTGVPYDWEYGDVAGHS